MPVGKDLHLGLAGAKAEEGVIPGAHDPGDLDDVLVLRAQIGGHFLVISSYETMCAVTTAPTETLMRA